jgi:uncharacterized protein (DUF3084 family)
MAKAYRRLTLFEELRWLIDDLYDIKRLRKAREDYVWEEGYNKAKDEDRQQLSAKDEELSARDEQLSFKDGQLSAREEEIRRLEEEVRRLREAKS